MSFTWQQGRAGDEFTEATDESSGDLLYTYKQDGKYGCGLRLEGRGLVFLQKPVLRSVEGAQHHIEAAYKDLCEDNDPVDTVLGSMIGSLPDEVVGAGGTPRWPF